MKAKIVSGYLGAIAGVIIFLLVETLFSAVLFRMLKMCLSADAGAIWIGSCILTGCTYIMLIGIFTVGACKDGKND